MAMVSGRETRDILSQHFASRPSKSVGKLTQNFHLNLFWLPCTSNFEINFFPVNSFCTHLSDSRSGDEEEQLVRSSDAQDEEEQEIVLST